MRRLLALAGVLVVGAAVVAHAQSGPAPAPNGVTMPQGYQDWRVIGVSERTDNNTLRVILGNDAAIEAARAGMTNPWPDGAILAKIVLNQQNDANWPTAIVPSAVRHVEFMIKDAATYAATGGWGYGRWLGMDLVPFGSDATFDQQCYGCHIPVASRDYVFTTPIILP